MNLRFAPILKYIFSKKFKYLPLLNQKYIISSRKTDDGLDLMFKPIKVLQQRINVQYQHHKIIHQY